MKITYRRSAFRVTVGISQARAVPRAVTAQEARLLDRARARAHTRVHGRHGFELRVVAGPDAPAGARLAYVVDDVAWARRHDDDTAKPAANDVLAQAREEASMRT